MTLHWTKLTGSHTSALQLPSTLLLTQKSLCGFEECFYIWTTFPSVYGITHTFPSAPKSASMMPVCLVYCFTVLKRGRRTGRQESRLSAFHTRCLRSILGVTWKDKLPNEELFRITKPQPLSSRLKFIRLRWAGHVTRMESHQIPRSILYRVLENGDRPVRRPKLCFKDVFKRDLVDFNTPTRSWPPLASHRSSWRSWPQLASHRSSWRFMLHNGTRHDHQPDNKMRRGRCP